MSSAFPINSSIPPIAIVKLVDDEFAFLSTLVPPAGAVRDAPSPKVVPGAPKLTASITVPLAREPLIKPKLLSFESVPLPVALQFKDTFRLLLHQRKNP